jgi:hypothetical protein
MREDRFTHSEADAGAYERMRSADDSDLPTRAEAERDEAEAVTLLPFEDIALTIGWAQVQRGETPTPNIAVVCVATLARITGRDDAS